MDSAPTYLDGIRVHFALVSTKAFYSCGSDVPLIHTVQESCLFPPLGWGQNPSNTLCSLLINMNWRSLQEDQNNISPSVLFENLPPGNWSRFILAEFPVVVSETGKIDVLRAFGMHVSVEEERSGLP